MIVRLRPGRSDARTHQRHFGPERRPASPDCLARNDQPVAARRQHLAPAVHDVFLGAQLGAAEVRRGQAGQQRHHEKLRKKVFSPRRLAGGETVGGKPRKDSRRFKDIPRRPAGGETVASEHVVSAFRERDEQDPELGGVVDEVLDRVADVAGHLEVDERPALPLLQPLEKPVEVTRQEQAQPDLEERHVLQAVDKPFGFTVRAHVQCDDETIPSLSLQEHTSRPVEDAHEDDPSARPPLACVVMRNDATMSAGRFWPQPSKDRILEPLPGRLNKETELTGAWRDSKQQRQQVRPPFSRRGNRADRCLEELEGP